VEGTRVPQGLHSGRCDLRHDHRQLVLSEPGESYLLDPTHQSAREHSTFK
jgi:hypothetical protein